MMSITCCILPSYRPPDSTNTMNTTTTCFVVDVFVHLLLLLCRSSYCRWQCCSPLSANCYYSTLSSRVFVYSVDERWIGWFFFSLPSISVPLPALWDKINETLHKYHSSFLYSQLYIFYSSCKMKVEGAKANNITVNVNNNNNNHNTIRCCCCCC